MVVSNTLFPLSSSPKFDANIYLLFDSTARRDPLIRKPLRPLCLLHLNTHLGSFADLSASCLSYSKVSSPVFFSKLEIFPTCLGGSFAVVLWVCLDYQTTGCADAL